MRRVVYPRHRLKTQVYHFVFVDEKSPRLKNFRRVYSSHRTLGKLQTSNVHCFTLIQIVLCIFLIIVNNCISSTFFCCYQYFMKLWLTLYTHTLGRTTCWQWLTTSALLYYYLSYVDDCMSDKFTGLQTFVYFISFTPPRSRLKWSLLDGNKFEMNSTGRRWICRVHFAKRSLIHVYLRYKHVIRTKFNTVLHLIRFTTPIGVVTRRSKLYHNVILNWVTRSIRNGTAIFI